MPLPVPAPVRYTDTPVRKLRYVWQLMQVVRERHGAPLRTQLQEMFILYLTRRIGPLLYFERSLWRKELPMSDKKKCLTSIEFETRLRELNPPEYRCLSDHKILDSALLRLAGVTTPEYLGYLHPHDGLDALGRPMTEPDQLISRLTALAPISFCLKPALGSQGIGFLAMRAEVHDGNLLAASLTGAGGARPMRDVLTDEALEFLSDGYIVQRYIEQHPVLMSLNPDSVNTLRLWVLQCASTVHVRGAILRIGRAGKLVDNSHQGGLYACVDLATGRLSTCGAMDLFPEQYSHHPDTGVLVEGVQLPYWEETIEVCSLALRALPNLYFSGLDIAISTDGPVVIETNAAPAQITARNFSEPQADLLDCNCHS